MQVALHHRAGFAGAHHGDRLVGGAPVVVLLDDAERDISAPAPSPQRRCARIADENRLDQALFEGQQRAAERIVVFRADDDGFQTRQLGGERHQMRKLFLLLHDQRRQRRAPAISTCASAPRRSRRPCRPFRPWRRRPMVSNTADGLVALFPAGHGDAQAVADVDAIEEFEILLAIERAGTGQDIAEHRRNQRTDPHRGRDRLASPPARLPRPAASADLLPDTWANSSRSRSAQARSMEAESPTCKLRPGLVGDGFTRFHGSPRIGKELPRSSCGRIGVRVPKPRRHGPHGDDRLKG